VGKMEPECIHLYCVMTKGSIERFQGRDRSHPQGGDTQGRGVEGGLGEDGDMCPWPEEPVRF
jgi:hypothetical protein